MSKTVKIKEVTSPKPTQDQYLFPRSEYCTRYKDTTYFLMDNPDFWDTYHRSEATRFHSTATNCKFHAGSLHDKSGNSFYSHAGSYHSPYKDKKYQDTIAGLPNIYPPKYLESASIYNKLLIYRKESCQKIIAAFAMAMNAEKLELEQDVRLPKEKSFKTKRPIVYMDNNFVCVMVQMPFVNLGSLGQTKEAQNESKAYEAVKYWSEHSSFFQDLMMAYYVAIVNYQADIQGIPIELVMRSGFGHLGPSVAETDKSFRIDMGIVPEQYAQLLGKCLVTLYKTFVKFSDKETEVFAMTQEQQKGLEQYNKLKQQSESQAKTVIEFKGTLWQALRQPANPNNGSLLREMLREQINVEQLANLALEQQYQTKGRLPNELPIKKMLAYLEYDKTVSFAKKIKVEYKKSPWKKYGWYKNNSIDDNKYWEIIKELMFSLSGKYLEITSHKVGGLYAYLEKLHVDFIGKANDDNEGQELDSDQQKVGSDSDFEGKITEDVILYSKKMITTTGMMAISCAYYIVKLYLRMGGAQTYTVTHDLMYYEVKNVLELVVDLENLNRQDKTGKEKILFFDLNYCNSNNMPMQTVEQYLKQKLQDCKPKAIILDDTSATTQQVNHALKTIYNFAGTQQVKLVLLAKSSGLKHEAGGADNNPWGTLRILSPEIKIANRKGKFYKDDQGCFYSLTRYLYEHIVEKLIADKNYLPPTAHNIRRRYKTRGLVPCTDNIINM